MSAPTPPRPQTPLGTADMPLERAESIAMPGRDAGFLQLRVVPDDNSCLFSAVGVVFEGGIEKAPALRKSELALVYILTPVVAEAIQNDSESYPDVVLGYVKLHTPC